MFVLFLHFCSAAIPRDGQQRQEVHSASVWSSRKSLIRPADGSRTASSSLGVFLFSNQCPGSVHLSPRLPHQTSSHASALSQTETSLIGRAQPLHSQLSPSASFSSLTPLPSLHPLPTFSKLSLTSYSSVFHPISSFSHLLVVDSLSLSILSHSLNWATERSRHTLDLRNWERYISIAGSRTVHLPSRGERELAVVPRDG